MKKTYLAFYICILLPCFCQAQRQLKNRFYKHTFFVGVALQPALQAEGFGDFDISDWQEYGLNSQNGGSAEGRVRVPLSNRINNSPTYGLGLLYRYNVSQSFGITAAIPFTLSKNVIRFGVLPGFTYQFVNKKGLIYTDDAFRIGISPAIGLDFVNIGFGKIKQVPGYTSPVIVKQGTFYDGYTLALIAPGFAYQAGLSLEYDVSDKVGLLLQAGYGGSVFGKPSIQVTDNEDNSGSGNSGNDEDSKAIHIKLNDASVVKTDLSATQAGISPGLRSRGLFALLSVGFKFGKK